MWYQTIIQNIVIHFTFHKKLYVIFGGLFTLIILFIFAIFLTIPNQPSSSINQISTSIKQTPSPINKSLGNIQVAAPVTGAQFIFNYDNRVYYIPTTINDIPAGSYTLTAHNTGYVDETKKITIEEGKTTSVTLIMKQQTVEESILQTESDWEPYFDSEGKKSKQEIVDREKKYPLTKVLPKVFGNAMLDYDVTNDGSVTYVVRPLPGKTYNRNTSEQAINNFINLHGIDPKTINIIWRE